LNKTSKPYQMKYILNLLFLLLSALTFSQSNLGEKIKNMMDATGDTERIKYTIDNIIKLKEKESAVVLDSLRWENIKNETLIYDDFITKLIPVYKEKYTEKEIEKITAFFNSKEGKAYLKSGSKVNREVLKELTISVQDLFYEMKDIYSNPLSDRFKNPTTNCSALKTGSFSYIDNTGKEVKISRSKGIQMEMAGSELYTYKIEWIDDCKYKVWDYQEDNNYKNVTSHIVSIYEVNEDSYKCVFKKEDEDKYFESQLSILK